MARPSRIREEDIIEAARRVFLERGVHATTAEVAQQARVSEGILFHRYKTKEALFQAALSGHLEEPAEIEGLSERLGEGTVEENLFDVCMAVITWLRIRIPLFMLMMGSRGMAECWKEREKGNPHPHERLVPIFAAYLAGEVRHKRLRKLDADLFGKALFGGLMQHVMSEVFQPVPRPEPVSTPVFLRGLIDLLLHGACPRTAPRTRKTKAL